MPISRGGMTLLPGKQQPAKMLPGEHHCPAERQHCPTLGVLPSLP